MTPEVHEQPGRGSAAHRRRWRILGLLGVAQLMLILDVTVVAIALPRIEIDLGLSRAVVTWTVSAYTLTFGGLLLLGGLLTAGPGWPWVFYINVPIGLVIAAAIARMVPHQRPPAPRARLDVLGALLVTAASGLGMFLPPVGVGLILVCAIARVEMSAVLRYFTPFLVMLTIGLLVLRDHVEPGVDDELRAACDLVVEVQIPPVGSSLPYSAILR